MVAIARIETAKLIVRSVTMEDIQLVEHHSSVWRRRS